MLKLLPFFTKLQESIQRLDHRIDEYVMNPNEEHIHDIRTAVRRFNASFSTLPKKDRGQNLSQYNQLANECFKANSEIRDLDIIYKRIKNYPRSDQKNNIIGLLKDTRKSKLENSKNTALSLKNIDSNTTIEKINITEKQLQDRYNKILSRLVSKIENTFPVVLTNPIKVEELHELRKDCKKIKYMLELLPEENKNSMELRNELQKIQDMLGAIHDFDITINYLKSLQTDKDIQKIITSEAKLRLVKYEVFLRFCKRRLHLASDSFLIRIKSLLT